jgi:hypothetical protein
MLRFKSGNWRGRTDANSIRAIIGIARRRFVAIKLQPACDTRTQPLQPSEGERGLAPTEDRQITIDIDAQRQTVVGWSDWLDALRAITYRQTSRY